MADDLNTEYKIDIADERLWSGNQSIPIGNKAFQLLRFFVENPNRLLTKDDILDTIWGDLCVTEGLVKEYVHDLRVALGDDPKDPVFIETIRGRGYRFLGGIEIIRHTGASNLEISTSPEVPTLAVLPFVNLSDDPDQEYFSDGITDDIITELSRFTELSVVARNSSYTFKERPVEIAEIVNELGANYVLEGKIQRHANRLRVTAKLIDTNSGRHIWGEKYDRELKDVFNLQDELTTQVVGSIAPQVEQAEIKRSRKLSDTNLSAYELALKAQALTYDAVRVADREILKQAMSIAEQGLKLDKQCSHALWTKGMGCVFQYLYGWSSDPGSELNFAIDIADHLIGIDPSNAKSYIVRAWAYQYSREYDLAIADYQRALDLNPNLALNLFTMAWSEAVAGLPDEARKHANKALKLSPRDTNIWLGWAYATLELASFIDCDFSDAVEWGRLAIQLHARMPAR
ncbi:MAG: winged helix-turn-helix domain-containing tetratricopeptide repeat protein, partial [bacterium]